VVAGSASYIGLTHMPAYPSSHNASTVYLTINMDNIFCIVRELLLTENLGFGHVHIFLYSQLLYCVCKYTKYPLHTGLLSNYVL
jgi:hypothetical protein